MLMKSLSLISVIICTSIINISHPIFLVLLISLQSFIMCTILHLMIPSTWFSFILFLVFIGGLMVLFIYISSLASNEKFQINFKLNLIKKISLMSLFLISSWYMMNEPMKQAMDLNVKYIIFKLYSPEIIYLLMATMIYLLLTLIISVNLTMKKEGSLRSLKN